MKSLKDIAAKSVLSQGQLEKLENIILGQGPYTREAVREELDWFCAGLGMNDYYFRTTPLKQIADHIRAIKAAEIIATIKEEKVVKVDLATEHANEAIYLVDDYHSRALEIERHIEEKYPNCRLQSYRTARKAIGLELLPRRPGNVLTCCKVPEGVEGSKLVKTMQGKYMAYIAGGQDPYKGKIFRIAHLGYMGGFDIITALSALEMTLMDLGYKFEAGAGIKAAQAVLKENWQ